MGPPVGRVAVQGARPNGSAGLSCTAMLTTCSYLGAFAGAPYFASVSVPDRRT